MKIAEAIANELKTEDNTVFYVANNEATDLNSTGCEKIFQAYNKLIADSMLVRVTCLYVSYVLTHL